MSEALGVFLDDYGFPLLGLGLLAQGAWSSWGLWKARPDDGSPALTLRIAALVLGAVWGWILTNLPHAHDAAHVTLGWPMPVMTLTKASGRWLELGARASLPCILLNLAIGVGMVNTLLGQAWKLRPRPRPRASLFDAWRVSRTAPRPGPGFAPPARRLPPPGTGGRVPVQGRAGHRNLAAFGLEESSNGSRS
ncbi:MAG: hypothetical protein P4L36_19260 [Holophaga sp.]|nr:hypothetical protein [Holophaga sp.]